MSDSNLDMVAILRDLNEFCSYNRLSDGGLSSRTEKFTKNELQLLDEEIARRSCPILRSACRNPTVTEETIRNLVDCFPSTVHMLDDERKVPLHHACLNHKITFNMVRILIEASPVSVQMGDKYGQLPLHFLSLNRGINEKNALEVLELLLEEFPESARRETTQELIPINLASGLGRKSPEFCRRLIEVYPGSERLMNGGMMPFQEACHCGTLATVKYLYKLYPDAIKETKGELGGPIHCAILGLRVSEDAGETVEVVRFLLECDPSIASQVHEDHLPFLRTFAQTTPSNSTHCFEIVKLLYDAYPEALIAHARPIIEFMGLSNAGHRGAIMTPEMRQFVITQMSLIVSRERAAVADANGNLPLHRALQGNACLGTVKLIVNAYPPALQIPAGGSRAMPLHMACQYHDSTAVIDLLIRQDPDTLNTLDGDGNTYLHCACHGAKYKTIIHLLENHHSAPVSKRNSQEKIPLEVLLDSNAVCDRDSDDYVDCVFRLLKANPETMMTAAADQMNLLEKKLDEAKI